MGYRRDHWLCACTAQRDQSHPCVHRFADWLPRHAPRHRFPALMMNRRSPARDTVATRRIQPVIPLHAIRDRILGVFWPGTDHNGLALLFLDTTKSSYHRNQSPTLNYRQGPKAVIIEFSISLVIVSYRSSLLSSSPLGVDRSL